MAQPIDAVGVMAFFHIFEVGLIQHHNDPLGNPRQEFVQRMGIEPGAGGVVRVGHEDNPGALGHCFRHGRQIMTKQVGRHLHRSGIAGQGHNRIHRKGILGKNCLIAFLQVGAGNQIQHIIGAIAQGQLVAGHIQFFRQCRFQRKGGTVRVQVQLVHMLERVQGLVAGPQRVFVAGQFDDIGNTQLSLQLVDGFTRLVGLELLDTAIG